MVGVLPQEIAKLPELVSINLSENDIVGNIPSAWASLLKLGKTIRYFGKTKAMPKHFFIHSTYFLLE